jgi:hypothetical protein
MNEGRMLAGWIVSNALALGLIIICWRRPKVGRAILGLGFIAAAVFNAWTVLADPQAYVRGFGPQALFPFYENFIYGPFARSPVLFILPIALGQLAIGLLMFARGAGLKLGLVGGTIFFLAVTPLGKGSAFPMPLLGVVAFWVLWHRSR